MEVREFVAPTEERLRMFLPPCYSPQPNLDERVWKLFEDDRVTRRVFWAKDEPKAIDLGAFHRSQGLQRSVCRLLGGPQLAYIAPAGAASRNPRTGH